MTGDRALELLRELEKKTGQLVGQIRRFGGTDETLGLVKKTEDTLRTIHKELYGWG